MIGIKEIYEIACCIKKLVEENDELKYENQKLRLVEKKYGDFLSSRPQEINESAGNIYRRPPFIRPYD